MLSSPVTLHGSIELFPHQHGAGEDVSDEVTSGDRRPRSAEQSAPESAPGHFLTVGDGRGSRRPHTHDFLWRRRRRDRARPWAARGLPLGQSSPASARGGRAPPFHGAARPEPRPRPPAPRARAAASACRCGEVSGRSAPPQQRQRRWRDLLQHWGGRGDVRGQPRAGAAGRRRHGCLSARADLPLVRRVCGPARAHRGG